MRAGFLNFLLIASCILLVSFAQVALKVGMSSVGKGIGEVDTYLASLPRVIGNRFVLMGLVAYVVSVVLWLFILGRVEVSFAYPFVAIAYVLVTLAGYFWLNESMSLQKAIGIGIICLGTLVLARS